MIKRRIAALEEQRPAAGEPGSPDDMAATLAQELGLSEAKVKAALEAVRPRGGPPSGTPPAATSS